MRRRARFTRRPTRHLRRRRYGDMVVTNVLGQSKEVEKVYDDGSYNCPFCGYAVRGGPPCQNPACSANPINSSERARGWLEAQERSATEARKREEERASINEFRRQYYEEQQREKEARMQAALVEAKKKGACTRCLFQPGWEYRPLKFVKHRGTCPKERR